MKNKILTSYKRQNDKDFAATTTKVSGRMDGNINFSNPPEELAIIKKMLPEFQLAIADASDRDRLKVSIKNDKRATIEAALNKLAEYVTQVSNGDRTTLLSSGFELSSPRTEATLGAISTLQVNIDRPNEATTRIKRARGARAYIHRYTLDPITPDSVWTSKVMTGLSHTFSGLSSKEKYVFQVIAVGYKEQESHSPMVVKVIQ